MLYHPGSSPVVSIAGSQVPASGFPRQFSGSIADRVYAIQLRFRLPAQHDAAPESKTNREIPVGARKKRQPESVPRLDGCYPQRELAELHQFPFPEIVAPHRTKWAD